MKIELNTDKKLVVICGPAGSGKTRLAKSIASGFESYVETTNAELINSASAGYLLEPGYDVVIVDVERNSKNIWTVLKSLATDKEMSVWKMYDSVRYIPTPKAIIVCCQRVPTADLSRRAVVIQLPESDDIPF